MRDITEEPLEPIMAKIANHALVNCREAPNLNAAILCTLKLDEEVMVEYQVGEWMHIYTSAGIEGYVMSQFLKEE